jgi:uncharacterized protein
LRGSDTERTVRSGHGLVLFAALDEGGPAVFQSHRRRQKQVVEFVDLVVSDAFEAPALAYRDLARRSRKGARTRPVQRLDGAVVCERCTIADSALPRMRGLLGKRDLPSDEGVLLRPAGSVHTFFMRFPIDIVFLDRDGRVLRIAESVRPWRTAAARGAKAVLELRAGECGRRRLLTGDVLEVGAA